MCGVPEQKGRTTELRVSPLPSTVMPPSITVRMGAPSKGCNTPTGQSDQTDQNASSKKTIPTIDLASDTDGDEELQKAIALSLQHQKVDVQVPGISSEDQQVSRALEASLKESRPQATIDNVNPRDRARVEGSPIGLKNIGNSCWFNVVIQTLLHIPGFRDLILHYSGDQSCDAIHIEPVKKSHPNIVLLLRQLFALLIGSKRKYVDPKTVVNVFQDQEMQKDTQQDVCEFIHKLLERLENEFQNVLKQQGIEKESSDSYVSKDSNFDNPIMQLFYGQSCNETNEAGCKTYITFGQYLLHVMNYKDIHQSILASMCPSMPDLSKDVISSFEQNTWFKMLPPVLIFSLSRYEFSKEKKRAEKVHNKFEFPEYLYMDRYMELNKEVIKNKHLKVAKIHRELHDLNKTLDKYMKFGSGEGKYPLNDILKYTLEFAHTNVHVKMDDHSVPSPSKMEVDSVESCELNDVEMGEENDMKKEIDLKSDLKTDEIKNPNEVNSPDRIPSPTKKMRIMPPSPGSMNANELSVLQSCLPRWQQEVELQVEELEKAIASLEQQLDEMYDDEFLQQIPYRLHAVVVHEGQASGGHYWVYIYDYTKQVWMKFNDIQVFESKWEDVLQDSIGGQNNASAYCLMYIDENRFKKLFPNSGQQISCSDLPIDLQELVKNDTLSFEKEICEWDEKVNEQREKQMNISKFEENKRCALQISESNSVNEINFMINIETMISQSIKNFLDKVSKTTEQTETSISLAHFINKELVRQKDFANQKLGSEGSEAHRNAALLDLGVYIIQNQPTYEILVKWYSCDMLRVLIQEYPSCPRIDQIKKEINKFHLWVQNNHSEEQEQLYSMWKSHYRNLIQCAWYFVQGFDNYKKQKYGKACVLLRLACNMNNQLESTGPPGNSKCIAKRIFSKGHRLCLQEYNTKIIEQFVNTKTQDDFWKIKINVSNDVEEFIIPGIAQLENSKIKEDKEAVARIRTGWCDLLESEQATELQQIVNDILNSSYAIPRQWLLSDSTPRIPPVLSLYKSFADVCSSVLNVAEKNTQTSDL